jgi:hypothetical protein
MNRLLLIAIVALAAGCTTYKLWSESGSDQDSGTVDLSYEFRKFESPQVDERAAIQMARERCRDWRFADAHRKSETRNCLDGTETSCGKWRVTRQYQCTK